MRRTPERLWSVEALTMELRASTLLVADLLMRFHRAGLVVPQGGCWVWKPAREDAANMARAAAEAHERTPQLVLSLIHEAPNARIRLFADAFKLRNDEDMT